MPKQATNYRSYGLNLAMELKEQSAEDWKFGAFSQKCIAIIPELEREQYLPKGEMQGNILTDFMDCTTRAPLNILECKFSYLYQTNKLSPENKMWLENNGYVVDGKVVFSDRFISILSGNTHEGNSFRAPLDCIHTRGLIPKPLLPAGPTMSWDEYYDVTKITPTLYTLGLEFNKRFLINYERAYRTYFPVLLKEDMLSVGGYAWPIPVNGIYPRSDLPPNHDFVGLRNPLYFIFDNYIDSVDGDWIKRLAPDYAFVDFGYRVYIAKESVVVPTVPEPVPISGNDRNILLQILQKMSQILHLDLLLIQLRGIFGVKPKPITPPDEHTPDPA